MTPEEIQQIFFVECEESLDAAEAGLAACQSGTQDEDTINGIFRAVHSIKGGAGAFGFVALQAYTHTFETLLSDVREGAVDLTENLIALLLSALDTLSDHVGTAREGGEAPDDKRLIAEMEAAMAGAVHSPAEPVPQSEVVSETQSSEAPSSDEGDDFRLDLDSLLDDITGDFDTAKDDESEPEGAERWNLHVRPHSGAMRNGSEPLLMLRDLADLDGYCVQCDHGQVPTLDGFDPSQGYFGWTFSMPPDVKVDAVRDIFDFVGEDCAIAIGDEGMPPIKLEKAEAPQPAAPVAPVEQATTVVAATPGQPVAPIGAGTAAIPEHAETSAQSQANAGTPGAGQSIRIDLFKLDRLIDLVGELVIAQAMLVQRLDGVGITATEELGLLENLTRDIQESAMSIRAQPINSVFSRVPRILRDLASTTGKHVKLETHGESTELDKTVIERLGEPLTHLIRNAVDHGIESAEDRIAAGKNPEGTLTLSAEHRSGRILISIADDGAGINRERVFAKAVEKGIVAPDAQLSAEEIDHLIFAPGFSTAETISSVSGRGVGMDVVRQNVKELGGRITIESKPGQGTAFVLTLPLTLAISDGMIVNVGDQTLVVPLAHVVESLRPAEGDVKALGANRHMLNVRGRYIPVLSLRDALGARSALSSPADGVLVVVDTESAGQAALLVDSIQDQRQFVIKSLATNFRPVDGVAGATILGDGRVALILDIDGLVACALPAQDRQAA